MSTQNEFTEYENNSDINEKLKTLGLRYKKECFNKSIPKSCHFLGLWYLTYMENNVEAMKVFLENCKTNKYPESCLNYAFGLLYGNGIKQDVQNSFDILKTNCEKNKHDKSCYAAGMILINGFVSHQPNFKDGLDFFEKGCDLNYAPSCFQSGLINLSDNQDLKKNLKKSAISMLKACDLGHPRACFNLSLMYKNGDYFEKNEQKFQELFDKCKNL